MTHGPRAAVAGDGLPAVAGLRAIVALSIALAGLARLLGRLPFRDRRRRLRRPAGAPPNLFIADGPGFDGQFSYRLALDPFISARSASGITLDGPAYRQKRILYPIAAWLLSWAHARAAARAAVGLTSPP